MHDEAVGRFAHDTTVEPIGTGRYRGWIDPGWGVLGPGAPNGGYLLAIAARAVQAALPEHPDPVSITAHYLSAAVADAPCEVEVDVLRRGGRHATATAVLAQDGVERLRLLTTFGHLPEAHEGEPVLRREPLHYDPGELIDVIAASRAVAAAGGAAPPPILLRFDHEAPPTAMGWAAGQPDGSGVIGGRCRLAGGERMDTIGLLVVADAYPPALFNLGETPVGWVPTVELTVQVRQRPTAGWLHTRFTTTAVTGPYLEEDGEIWDDAGNLVALSRQLALLPRRPS